MKCPECQSEQSVGTKQCTVCGSDLTQTALMGENVHRTNQVWNTEIDKEKNQKNSRSALIVLAVSVALLLGLVAVFVGQISSMDFSIPEMNFEEFFAKREPQPEPDIHGQTGVVIIDEGADKAFLRTAEDFLREFYSAKTEGGDMHQAKVVMSYLQAFERFELRILRKGFGTAFVVESDFSDGNLQNYASAMLSAVRKMADSVNEMQVTDDHRVLYIADRLLWAEGHVELAEAVRELVWYGNLLQWESQIPLYFTDRLPYYTACVELEADLQNQLPTEPSIPGDASYPYTNNTMYSMDIVFYNEYLTEDGALSDYVAFNGVERGETIVVPLANRPARAVADQVVWTIRWDIMACYQDGVNVME